MKGYQHFGMSLFILFESLLLLKKKLHLMWNSFLTLYIWNDFNHNKIGLPLYRFCWFCYLCLNLLFYLYTLFPFNKVLFHWIFLSKIFNDTKCFLHLEFFSNPGPLDSFVYLFCFYLLILLDDFLGGLFNMPI
jgi:hypothetical protein